ncbi:sigma-70 family RNA polymerase sigma factor [Cereibacter johrii]|uniref:sigma-70 family RNA polymerase sigma factor n=1 Tax=Cereibacter johrii TaxID=445629 RepID=UPI000DCDFE29|nr:sigma-70 family RNA polymerase sigma factor [Cereibacter johrii]RAZ83420.1 hypothetical protein DDV93_14005 [Cereibacter johrii]
MSQENMRAPQTALAIAAQAGDEKAKAELVRAVEPLVKFFLRRAMKNPGLDPEDVRSELVKTVFRSLQTYDQISGPFGSYIATCMKWRIPEIVRLRRMIYVSHKAERKLHAGGDGKIEEAAAAAISARPVEIDDELGLEADPEADRLTEGAAHTILAEELSRLDDRDRAVIAMRFADPDSEKGFREIGSELGVSGERIRQIQLAALKKLRLRLEARGLTLADLPP